MHGRSDHKLCRSRRQELASRAVTSCGRILAVILGILSAPQVIAQCVKHTHAPVDIDRYYETTIGTTGPALKAALNQRIRGHTYYSYTPCVWEILKIADEAPGDADSVIGIYTNRHIAKTLQDNGSRGNDAWNREHIWANSHGFPRRAQHGFTDVHHIRAADRSVNADRASNDFEDGGTPDDECAGCREGAGTWEPPDRVKGDIARMMFYMDVRYEGSDSSGTPDLQLVDRVGTARSSAFGEFGKLCTLMQWHNDDPVSDVERRRNDVVHSWQGNRNPFIDRPDFAFHIWGNLCEIDTPDPLPPGLDLDAIRARIQAIETELEAIKQILDRATEET